jgi:dTDP-4-dehydrorhamnose 3,5-epimerase
MIYRELPIPGAWLIEPDRKHDERGYFARCWCRREAASHGIDADWVQSSDSFSNHRGTLRGLHYQIAPHQEQKLVRCVRGSIFDVIVDLRSSQPTFGRWFGCELSAEAGAMLFIPRGCAHGFQSLTDGVEVLYQMSEYYVPAAARGISWDDPEVGIDWPRCSSRIVSKRDQSFPRLAQCTEF